MHGSPVMVALMSFIMGALLDLLRPDGQSTSILTTGPSLADMSTRAYERTLDGRPTAGAGGDETRSPTGKGHDKTARRGRREAGKNRADRGHRAPCG